MLSFGHELDSGPKLLVFVSLMTMSIGYIFNTVLFDSTTMPVVTLLELAL
jgi:hypothetical protein